MQSGQMGGTSELGDKKSHKLGSKFGVDYALGLSHKGDCKKTVWVLHLLRQFSCEYEQLETCSCPRLRKPSAYLLLLLKAASFFSYHCFRATQFSLGGGGGGVWGGGREGVKIIEGRLKCCLAKPWAGHPDQIQASFAQYDPGLLLKNGTKLDAGSQIQHIRSGLILAAMTVTGRK